MSIPPFVSELRAHVGTSELWLSGVTTVILNAERTRVLLVRRADNGQWTPVTGIIDPGEQPADAAVRESWEEAAVRITPERLVSVDVVGPVVYENGDRTRYLDLAFKARYDEGDPRPADGENSEVRWFSVDDLPELNDRFRRVIARALSDELPARFDWSGPVDADE